MGRYRSFTVRPPKPSFTKRAIELWTADLIKQYGNPSDRRDHAADYLHVSRRAIDAWCSASDPRVISAEMLIELAIGATLGQAAIMKADEVYDLVCGTDVLGAFKDVSHASFIADMRGYEVVRRDSRPVQMSEEQTLRSRLRKQIAAGYMTLSQLSEFIGGDDYAIVDKIVELRRRDHKRLWDFTIDKVDYMIRLGYDKDWAGEAA